MKVRLCDPESYWYCEITLEPHEWPALDEKDAWLHRPIRKWVYDNCYSNSSFGAAGRVLFQTQEDALAFYLTWHQPQ